MTIVLVLSRGNVERLQLDIKSKDVHKTVAFARKDVL